MDGRKLSGGQFRRTEGDKQEGGLNHEMIRSHDEGNPANRRLIPSLLMYTEVQIKTVAALLSFLIFLF